MEEVWDVFTCIGEMVKVRGEVGVWFRVGLLLEINVDDGGNIGIWEGSEGLFCFLWNGNMFFLKMIFLLRKICLVLRLYNL